MIGALQWPAGQGKPSGKTLEDLFSIAYTDAAFGTHNHRSQGGYIYIMCMAKKKALDGTTQDAARLLNAEKTALVVAAGMATVSERVLDAIEDAEGGSGHRGTPLQR
jgi:hypothetical protein